jgi:murein hydrolase activator
VERDRLTTELRETEMSAGNVRATLEDIRRERAEKARRRAELAKEKTEEESQLQRERAALAGQMRAAYLIGQEEPLKLLLNQEDPSRAGRMFAYYSYFGHARASRIAGIAELVSQVDALAAQLDEKDRELAALEAQHKAEWDHLQAARQRRSAVLASLDNEARTREQNLERLKRQQAGLEKLVKELKRAIERFPIDNNDAFAKLRGKLAWPVSGRLLARYGEKRAGGLKWEGVLVSTERGAPVRAVYRGRVVYADWLPGLGLLTIVDHGDGYLSLYGQNDRLYKAVGDTVSAGDTIAAAGDSGGHEQPEVYFEIRKGGKPVDPRPWFKAAVP